MKVVAEMVTGDGERGQRVDGEPETVANIDEEWLQEFSVRKFFL